MIPIFTLTPFDLACGREGCQGSTVTPNVAPVWLLSSGMHSNMCPSSFCIFTGTSNSSVGLITEVHCTAAAALSQMYDVQSCETKRSAVA